MNISSNSIKLLLGLDAQQLNLWQMGLRAAIVYISAFLMVRIVGDRRFIGKYAAFDVILSIIFGSTLSRAINGSSAFFPSIFAGFVLVGMHWLFSTIAFHSQKLERKIKGQARVLINNGKLCPQAMKASHITQQDLESTLRLKCNIDRLDRVDKACLESNGDISFRFKARLTQD